MTEQGQRPAPRKKDQSFQICILDAARVARVMHVIALRAQELDRSQSCMEIWDTDATRELLSLTATSPIMISGEAEIIAWSFSVELIEALKGVFGRSGMYCQVFEPEIE